MQLGYSIRNINIIRYLGEGLLAVVTISIVFYNHLIAVLPLSGIIPIYIRIRKRRYDQKKKTAMSEQFKEGMNAVAVALSAGYSVENAFAEARKEVYILYGAKSDIAIFFNKVNELLAVNRNIEDVLCEFAAKTQIADIMSFAEVFSYAKRSGGDMVEIIKNTVATISQKTDTAREISVLISAKQLEQLIMDVVPIAIILYLRVTSPELVGRLYGNVTGIVVMTACLIVYGAAVVISLRISDIRV